jgi:hypothetical protein
MAELRDIIYQMDSISLLCHSLERQSPQALSVNLLQAILLEKLGGCICC